jgi:hypothetical protein
MIVNDVYPDEPKERIMPGKNKTWIYREAAADAIFKGGSLDGIPDNRVDEILSRVRPETDDDEIGLRIDKRSMALSRQGLDREKITAEIQKCFPELPGDYKARIGEGIRFSSLIDKHDLTKEMLNRAVEDVTKKPKDWRKREKRLRTYNSIERPSDGKHRKRWMGLADEDGVMNCPVCHGLVWAEHSILAHIVRAELLSDDEERNLYSTLFVCRSCDPWIETWGKNRGQITSDAEGRFVLNTQRRVSERVNISFLGAKIPYWNKPGVQGFWCRHASLVGQPWTESTLDSNPLIVL